MSTVPVTYDTLTENPTSAFPAVPLRDPNNPAVSYTLYPENAVVGLGRRQVLPDTRFTIQAWYENNLNDYYEINVEGQRRATASEIVRAVRSSYDLTIPGTVMPEGEATMYARVVRAISGQESRSVPQTILIKTTIPGGIDREVGDSWVSGLSMRIENLPEYSPIDANVAARGMMALISKYENCRGNDLIVVFASGIRVVHTVSPAEAAGPGPIRVPIPPDVIRAGNQLGDYQIAFKVIDVVKNVSGGVDAQYPFSKPYILNSELDPSLLPYPLLLADGVESPVVDLGTQSNAIFSVEVSGLPLVRPVPTPPNQIVLVFTVTDANGFISTLRLPPVASLNLRSQTIPVDSAYIRRMAGTSVRVSFELQSASGAPPRRSGSYPFQVVAPPPMAGDFTPFANYDFNGWVQGPAVRSGDLRFRPYEGTLNLYNNTNDGNNAGVVLKKTFHNMQVGARYRFCAEVARWIGLYYPPVVSLATNQGPLTVPTTITSMWPHFVLLCETFTANSSTVEFQFVCNQATGVGNDYAVRNFSITRL